MTALRNTLAALLHRLPAGVAAGGGDRVRGRAVVLRSVEETTMTLSDALLFVIGHFLAIWLLTVAIGFADGWFAKRRK